MALSKVVQDTRKEKPAAKGKIGGGARGSGVTAAKAAPPRPSPRGLVSFDDLLRAATGGEDPSKAEEETEAEFDLAAVFADVVDEDEADPAKVAESFQVKQDLLDRLKVTKDMHATFCKEAIVGQSAAARKYLLLPHFCEQTNGPMPYADWWKAISPAKSLSRWKEMLLAHDAQPEWVNTITSLKDMGATVVGYFQMNQILDFGVLELLEANQEA